MTIASIYESWYAQKRIFVKKSSASVYYTLCQNHVLPYWGETNISDITNSTVQDWVLFLIQESELSNKTAADIIIVLKMIIDFHNEKNNIPAVRFKLRYPTSNNRGTELEVYSPEEQNKILKHCLENPSPATLAIAIVLCTGMRIGEICALKWENVDLNQKLIHIRQTIQRIYIPDEAIVNKRNGKRAVTQIVFDDPKTTSSHRSVPIASMILPLLKNYRKIVNDNYFVNTCSPHFSEPRTFRAAYYRILKEDIGLKRTIHFHGLRHSFATRLIASGADVKTTSKILGHAKVEMTMNLYVHPTEANKVDAINKALKGAFK